MSFGGCEMDCSNGLWRNISRSACCRRCCYIFREFLFCCIQCLSAGARWIVPMVSGGTYLEVLVVVGAVIFFASFFSVASNVFRRVRDGLFQWSPAEHI